MYKINKFPFIVQHDERDCGAACFSMIAEYFGKKMKLEKCRSLIKLDTEGASIFGIIKGAEKIGLEAEAYEGSLYELINEIKDNNVKLPIIVRVLSEEKYEHFIVLYSINNKFVKLGDPAKNGIRRLSIEQFEKTWLGQFITFEKNKTFVPGNEREQNIRKYLIEIKKQKVFLFFVLFGASLIMLINLAGAYLFRFILSDSYNVFYIWGHVVSNGIEKICITLILLYLFRIFVEIIRCNILTKISKNIDMSITMGFYKHLIKIRQDAFDVRQTGDFISRFYDTTEIRDAVSSVVLSVIMDAAMVVVSSVFLARINVKMFLISVITVTLYAIVVFGYKYKIKKNKNDIMAAESKVITALKETVDGIKTIKSYNLEKDIYSKTLYFYEKFADKVLIGTRIVNTQNALATFIASSGIVIVIGLGYKQYLKGALLLEDLFTFYYMLDYFLGPISGLIKLQPNIESAITAADRLADIMDIDVEKEKNCDYEIEVLDGDIILNNVTFRYGYNQPVINQQNMIIQKGTKTAIVGYSGSGKTTIAKLLMGFYYPEEGTIHIGDVNLRDCPVSIIRNSIAYISQEPFLFEDTLINNLTLGHEDINFEDVEKVVEKCGLSELINRLSLGYYSLIAEGGKNLSGGEKQRIAIARALLSGKKIIILDEVTSGLDYELRNKINKMISEISHDMTCIIITHGRDVIEFCDKVYNCG